MLNCAKGECVSSIRHRMAMRLAHSMSTTAPVLKEAHMSGRKAKTQIGVFSFAHWSQASMGLVNA